MDILVAVDLGDDAQEVLDRALPWAARLSGKIHLRAVSAMMWVADDVFGGGGAAALADEWHRRRRTEETALAELEAAIPARMTGAHEVLAGSPAPSLLRAAENMDLVIMGTHRRTGMERMFLGSVAEQVVREANVPVLVTPKGSKPIPAAGPLRVVLPVDANEPSMAAARIIHRWFGADADLHLVYGLADVRVSQELGLSPAVESPDRHPHYDWALTQLKGAAADAGVEATLHTVITMGRNPAQELATFIEAEEADLVAMPTHGRTGLSRLAYGSVTERLVRLNPVPSLVVR